MSGYIYLIYKYTIIIFCTYILISINRITRPLQKILQAFMNRGMQISVLATHGLFSL